MLKLARKGEQTLLEDMRGLLIIFISTTKIISLVITIYVT